MTPPDPPKPGPMDFLFDDPDEAPSTPQSTAHASLIPDRTIFAFGARTAALQEERPSRYPIGLYVRVVLTKEMGVIICDHGHGYVVGHVSGSDILRHTYRLHRELEPIVHSVYPVE